MPPSFRGYCLCGAVRFTAASLPLRQINGHCDDCRRSTGSVYARLGFIPAAALTVTGETARYEHGSDSGNTMAKIFCPRCGSQLLTTDSGHPARLGVRVGVIDDASWFQPVANVYTCRRLPLRPLDTAIVGFEGMPS